MVIGKRATVRATVPRMLSQILKHDRCESTFCPLLLPAAAYDSPFAAQWSYGGAGRRPAQCETLQYLPCLPRYSTPPLLPRRGEDGTALMRKMNNTMHVCTHILCMHTKYVRSMYVPLHARNRKVMVTSRCTCEGAGRRAWPIPVLLVAF